MALPRTDIASAVASARSCQRRSHRLFHTQRIPMRIGSCGFERAALLSFRSAGATCTILSRFMLLFLSEVQVGQIAEEKELSLFKLILALEPHRCTPFTTTEPTHK